MPILTSLRNDSNGYMSLVGRTNDSAILAQIAMDTLSLGYSGARAILRYVYNQQFDEPILPLVNYEMHGMKKKKNLYVHSKRSQNHPVVATDNSFNLYPNPANNKLTIQYTLDKNVQSASIELFDELGNKILTWQLSTSQTSLNENIGNLQEGFYMYSIIVSNKVYQRGKLVITR